jgi:hypothetical protein
MGWRRVDWVWYWVSKFSLTHTFPGGVYCRLTINSSWPVDTAYYIVYPDPRPRQQQCLAPMGTFLQIVMVFLDVHLPSSRVEWVRPLRRMPSIFIASCHVVTYGVYVYFMLLLCLSIAIWYSVQPFLYLSLCTLLANIWEPIRCPGSRRSDHIWSHHPLSHPHQGRLTLTMTLILLLMIIMAIPHSIRRTKRHPSELIYWDWTIISRIRWCIVQIRRQHLHFLFSRFRIRIRIRICGRLFFLRT